MDLSVISCARTEDVPTPLEDWVCRTMIATYGFLAVVGVAMFPLSILFGWFVARTMSEISSAVWHGGVQQLDWAACLALAGVGLFLWDVFMLIQFWCFVSKGRTLVSPPVLWMLNIGSMAAWMIWFLLGSESVGWLRVPGFWLYALAFLMWPGTGLILSGCALHDRVRHGRTRC